MLHNATARRLKPAATAFLVLAAFFSLSALLPAPDVLAQTPAATPDTQSATSMISQGLDRAASGTYQGGSITSFIGNIISAILAVTGVVFMVLTVYAGGLYMTAMGEPDKVKKAKTMLTQALIGIVIIVGAYALSRFVVNALTQASQITTQQNPG